MPLNESFNNFFTICRLILSTYRDKNIKIINRDIIAECFTAYDKTVAKTLPKDHSKYFLAAFDRNRIDILADKSNEWIKNGNVYIQLNEGTDNMKTKFRIHLSNIYNRACELTEKANKEFASLPLNSKHDISNLYPEVAYVDLLLYRFLCLIHDFMEYNVDVLKEEIKALGKSSDENLTHYLSEMKDIKLLISKYAKHMSVNNVKSMVKAPEVTSTSKTENNNPMAGLQNLDLSALIKTITSGMGGKNGGANIANAVSKITENPKVKSLIQDTMNTFNNSKDAQEALTSIIGMAPRLQGVAEDVSKEISLVNYDAPTEEVTRPTSFVPIEEVEEVTSSFDEPISHPLEKVMFDGEQEEVTSLDIN